MSFRNRCQIAGSEGIIDLSVPLEKGRDQKTLMKDVRIAASRSWQAQHWKTIVSCYSRSPWFEFYRGELEGLYKTRYEFLVDWNRVCFEWSLRQLGVKVGVSLTDDYRRVYGPEEGVDMRGKLMPKNREQVSGMASGKMARYGGAGSGEVGGSGVGEAAAGPGGAGRYRQVFEERTGFIPGLSILDLLFCEGKNAIKYIRS